jgi:maleate cis-trans isomerase
MKSTPMIGFISPPAWFDPAPSEFPRVVVEAVETQQAPMPLPDFDYRLESIANVQPILNQCAHSLKSSGCEIAAQVGSPFAWACAASEQIARARCSSISAAAGIPAVMTSLAIVDGLRALNANRVAVTCTYYDAEWREGFAAFLRMCGFSLDHGSTLLDQGLIKPEAVWEIGWAMTDELVCQSIRAVAEASPDAEAIVVTGAGARTLRILVEMEADTKRPIIAADTALYWAAARQLGLTLQPVMGALANAW